MPESIIVLQARTSSSRLPAKVLLPITEYPVVILAALRATNTGRKIIVATSDDQSDDFLETVLCKYNLPLFRGSLLNVLGRIVNALHNYSDDTIVCRLTSDNVIPDGEFLDRMEDFFVTHQLRYLTSTGSESGLPYGISAEFIYLSDLRQRFAESSDIFELEHVTPCLATKYGKTVFPELSSVGKSHYRATIDNFDDYHAIQTLFKNVRDPVNESLSSLLKKLECIPYQPVISCPASKLVLGTAQLGTNYGINNETGRPDEKQASEIIRQTISNGVTWIDTARAYGNSEFVIGNALKQGWWQRAKVVTKLSPLSSCPESASKDVLQNFVDASIYRSCTELRTNTLHTLLLHRATHLKMWDGYVWEYLKSLKTSGVIQNLGVSVQTPAELRESLEDPAVSHVQLPFNLLDYRWDECIPLISAARSKNGLVVHSRSTFLQGLLLSNKKAHWERAGCNSFVEIIDWLRSVCTNESFSDIADLCLSYCLSRPWIDGVIIGVETLEQLHQNLKISQSDRDAVCWETLISSRPKVNKSTLNPSNWSLK